MKASELIKELEKAIEEHGDLEVECSDHYMMNGPKKSNQRYIIK